TRGARHLTQERQAQHLLGGSQQAVVVEELCGGGAGGRRRTFHGGSPLASAVVRVWLPEAVREPLTLTPRGGDHGGVGVGHEAGLAMSFGTSVARQASPMPTEQSWVSWQRSGVMKPKAGSVSAWRSAASSV